MVTRLRCNAAIGKNDARWQIGARWRGRGSNACAWLCVECGDGLRVLEALDGPFGDSRSWTGARFITALWDPTAQFTVVSRRREPPL